MRHTHPLIRSLALTLSVIVSCGWLVSCKPTDKTEDEGKPTQFKVSVEVASMVPSDPSLIYLTDEQKALLADLPVNELPREAIDLTTLQPSQIWMDTLIPMASDAEADVTLYGVVEGEFLDYTQEPLSLNAGGIVLRCKDQAVYFPFGWGENARCCFNPWMEVADFDGDGADEAAVCLDAFHGTGSYEQALYFIDLDTLEYATPDCSTLDIDVFYDPSTRTAHLSSGEHTLDVELPEHIKSLEKVLCGYIVYFSYEDGQMVFRTSLDFSGLTLDYFADVTAPVIFEDGAYRLGPLSSLTPIDF